MITRFRSGDVEGSLEIARALIPSFVYESSDDAPNPVPLKAVLRALGLPGGECRLPMGPAPSGLEQRARAVLAELDDWRHTRSFGG
jgi:4-hydroxy-tetrahydrodipicolinate synthase